MLCACWLPCSTLASPQLDIRLKTTHYAVTVGSKQSWASQLAQASPFQGEHRGLAARTFWKARAEFDVEPRDGESCYLLAPKVVLNVEVVLPQLQPRYPATPSELERWVGWYDALRAHEQAHIDLLDKGFSPLVKALRFPVFRMSCSELRAHVAGLVEDYAVVVKRMNDRYDAETQHGLSEGVIFPFN